MMKFVVALLLVTLELVHLQSLEHTTCQRKYKKLGCFKRQKRIFPYTAITVEQHHIDLNEFENHLHSLACRCYEKVKYTHKYFAIGYFGTCHAGNDENAFMKMIKDVSHVSNECYGGNLSTCDDEATTECTGTEDSEYVYAIETPEPTIPSPVNGGYSQWIEWGKCDATCGKGKQARERACNSPPPSKLGKDCSLLGPSTEERECKIKDCVSETQLKSKTLVETIPLFGTIWSVSFDIKIIGTIKTWGSVVHFTTKNNHADYGSRIPAVWTSPGKSTLHIASAVNGNKNYYIETKPLPLNKFVSVKIEQTYTIKDKYMFNIYIDGKLVHSIENKNVQDFRSVKVYKADPWYSAANAAVKNLKYDNLKDGFQLKKGNLIETIPSLGKVWSLSFDLTLFGARKSWGSIVHFTNGKNHGSYGDRVPAIWTRPGSTRLHFTSAVNSKVNYIYDSHQLPLKKIVNIKVEHKYLWENKYQYNIYIDGKRVHSVENTNVQKFKNVKVYVADPWYEPADGTIKNFKFDNLHDGYLLKKNNLIDTIPVMSKVWTLSFDVMIHKVISGWGNILHFTIGKNAGREGDRMPAIWTKPGTSILYIASSVNKNPNFYKYTKTLPLNKFVNVKVEQIYTIKDEYVYSIYISGEKLFTVINKYPKEFRDLKVYGGDPWYNAADAVIKNFKFQNNPDGFQLTKGNLIETIPSLGKVWSLSFDLTLFGARKSWGSIVHFTNDKNHGSYGDRVPAIWTRPGSTRLHFTSAVNSKVNYIYDSQKLLLKKSINIKVEHKYLWENKYQYNIYIDGKRVHSVENTNVQKFKNVKVYVADPWYEPADGTIKNFKFDNLHDGYLLKKNNLIDTIPVMSKVWTLSFDVMIHKVISGWGNILHFTIGKNAGREGDRMPAIWTKPGTSILYIASSVNKNPNFYKYTKTLPLNKFVNVKVEQIYTIKDEYVYSIYISGEKLFTVINKYPKEFRDLKVYGGDPWYNAADAVIKNFKFQNNPDGFQLTKGNLIETIPSLGKVWSLSFDLTLFGARKSWGSIVHFTNDKNHGSYGDRVPAIWTRPGSTRLHFTSAVNSKVNYIYDSQKLLLKKSINIKVEHKYLWENKYQYNIYIDGKRVHSVENTNVQDFKNVKVYVADPWYEPADGTIKNFKFDNLHDGYLLKKNNLINTIPVMSKVWTLSFDVMIHKVISGWGNILHFTIGKNAGREGDRMPAIWTKPGTSILCIASAVNKNANFYKYTKALPLNKFVNVKVQQSKANGKYVYSIYVGGENVLTVINNHPKEFSNMKVYGGDPWHSAADAVVKNFNFQTQD